MSQSNNVAIVYDRQNLLDVALQYYGDARAAFDISILNGINVTDDIFAGQVIELPPISQYKNPDVLAFYNLKKVIPVTNIHIQTGVGYWSLEQYIII